MHLVKIKGYESLTYYIPADDFFNKRKRLLPLCDHEGTLYKQYPKSIRPPVTTIERKDITRVAQMDDADAIKMRIEQHRRQRIEPTCRAILELLRDEPLSCPQISDKTGLDHRDVAEALVMLCSEGHIQHDPIDEGPKGWHIPMFRAKTLWDMSQD